MHNHGRILQIGAMTEYIKNVDIKAQATYPITFHTMKVYHEQETIKPRILPFHQILLVLDGSGTLYCSGKTYPIKKGCAFFTAQGTEVGYTNNGGFISAFLTARGAAADMLAQNILQEGLLLIENADLEKYVTFISDLIANYKHGSDQGQLSAITYSIFVDFLSQRKREFPLWLEKTTAFIHLHFREKLTLEELAKREHVSVSKLCHSFKEYYGTSVLAYIMIVRLQYARDLLRNFPELMIKEVATSCGFSDVGYFCKTYRAKYHKSPSEEKLQ